MTLFILIQNNVTSYIIGYVLKQTVHLTRMKSQSPEYLHSFETLLGTKLAYGKIATLMPHYSFLAFIHESKVFSLGL